MEDKKPSHENTKAYKKYEEKELKEELNDDLDLLEDVVKRYEVSRDYVRDHYDKVWEDSWKSYHNQRTSSQYAGIASNFVPETFTIVESIKANIIGGEQRFEYYPTRDDQKADTKALNALVEHYWYTNNFPAETLKWIQDDIVLGTGIMWTFWDGERGVVPLYVPLKDFFVDPTAKNYQDAQYAGFRYLTTEDELEQAMVYDPKTKKMIPRFKNLDQVKDTIRKDSDETDKERKDSLLGSTLGETAKKKQVEVIYYVDKEKLVQIANRSVVIESVETPFKRKKKTVKSFDDMGNPVSFEMPEIKPFLPFAPARNYVDGALFYGRGDVEIILPSQELLNDTSSQKTDNLTYIVNKIVMVDPAYADEADKFDSIPGAKWFLPPGAVEWLTMQPIGNDADNEMLRITDGMRRATAADEIIQGGGTQKGRQTATEIRAQLAQAGTRFSIKLKNLEREGMKILADNMFKLVQIYVTKEIAVRSIGQQGVEFLNFNPGEFLGDYEPRVMLDSTAAAVAEEEKQNAMMFFQMASQLPFVNAQELFKQTAQKMFDIPNTEIDVLMAQLPPQSGMELPMGPEGAAMAPEQGLPPEAGMAPQMTPEELAAAEAMAAQEAPAGPAPEAGFTDAQAELEDMVARGELTPEQAAQLLQEVETGARQ